MQLLIDIGNSQIKWAYLHDSKLTNHGSADRGQQVPEVVAQTWLTRPAPDFVTVANVAGQDYGEKLDQWLQQHWQRSAEYIQVSPGFGLGLAYQRPEQLGVDRWLAMLAAHQLSDGPVAVVDVGTAMTVDVVSAKGKHMGGVITPGLRLMMDVLQHTSSGIQLGLSQDRQETQGLLGNNTSSCIEKGVIFALTGAIEHLLHSVEQQASINLSVIITGGDAEKIITELQRECRHVADLVLQGLQIVKAADA